MVDTTDLQDLDPYELLDEEASRIDAHLSTLPADEWRRPSRCAGWSVRDVAAHLAATEAYHHACLDGTVRELFSSLHESGVSALGDVNEMGVRRLDHLSNDELLSEWRTADATTRRRMRERDGGEMDSSIGPYPVRLQAFHVASELATHADDMGVPVDEAEVRARSGWRAQVSRFVLKESTPDLAVSRAPGGTLVVLPEGELTFGDEALVELVAGRATEDVDPALREALSRTP